MIHKQGKIIKGIGGFYYIKTTDSDSVICCKARGNFRYKKMVPMIGDIVEIEIKEFGESQIRRILPRKNAFERPPVANVDLALIVFSVTAPAPNLVLLDKMLIETEWRSIEPLILFTKKDLADPKEIQTLQKIYKNTGYSLMFLSKDSEIKPLIQKMQGKTTFMAGPSGVGKSTLTNRICQGQVMKIGTISEKTERGKHTTRHIQLIELSNGGSLLDTPGFSALDLNSELPLESLTQYYPEFSQVSCKFANCQHINEPGCKVKEAVENGQIHPVRYQNYCHLWQNLKSRKKKY